MRDSSAAAIRLQSSAPLGREIARGLAGYDADEARQITGRKSAEIEAILGYAGRAAMIHRDDMVMTLATRTGLDVPARDEAHA